MILVDSNIVIYSRQPGYDMLRQQLSQQDVAACSVIQIEVLGWHLLEPRDELVFKNFFQQAAMYQLDEPIIKKTIEVRRLKPGIHLPDAIIAATALVNRLELWTANIDDFIGVKGLKLNNPLELRA